MHRRAMDADHADDRRYRNRRDPVARTPRTARLLLAPDGCRRSLSEWRRFASAALAGSAMVPDAESSHAGATRSASLKLSDTGSESVGAPLLLCCLLDSAVWLAPGASSSRRECSRSPCSLPALSRCACGGGDDARPSTRTGLSPRWGGRSLVEV